MMPNATISLASNTSPTKGKDKRKILKTKHNRLARQRRIPNIFGKSSANSTTGLTLLSTVHHPIVLVRNVVRFLA